MSGLNSAAEILELSAQTPLQFSKQGPVTRIQPHLVELRLPVSHALEYLAEDEVW